MNVHVNTITRCSANGLHYPIEVVIAGVTYVIEATKADMDLDYATKDAARDAIIARCRSAVKEANATTFAQIQTALTNKDFKL